MVKKEKEKEVRFSTNSIFYNFLKPCSKVIEEKGIKLGIV